jgi:hypothetical protein
VEEGEYLIDYLLQVGPASSSGMGLAVISFTELQAWQACAGIVLQPWEGQILRRLSADYITESVRAEKPDCPPPYGNPELEFDRDVVGKKIANALKAFARAQR